MNPKHLSASALLLLVPVASAAPRQAPLRTRSSVSLERVSDSGAFGVVTLDFDADDYAGFAALAASDAVCALGGFPLPGGLRVDLELRPVRALASGARARVVQADGSETRIESRALCFSGRVVGGGPAFLGVLPGQLHGYLTAGGERYFLSSDGSRGRATVAHGSEVGNQVAELCGLSDGLRRPPEGGVEFLSVGPVLRTADVFIEADNQFRARFTTDQDCFDYTTLLLTAASEIYRRDVGLRLSIPDGYLRIWNKTPPWGQITRFAHMDNVQSWWTSTANPLRGIPRAAVHVLTHPIFGGTSRGISGLCDNSRGYELSSLAGRFPYPVRHTDRENWDLFVVCHEFGHTFGSVHSSQYSPPILCQDGSGPDSGTLMSYCHLDYGIAGVGMRFHLREQQRMRRVIAGASCPRVQVLLPGDYDGDGDRDPSDLAAARAVLAQGFRSLGAEEVFDMDYDLDLDERDLDLLAEIVYAAPPARASFRNGSGTNPSCLQALGNPVLGSTWSIRILSPVPGNPTLLVGYDQALDGVPTLRGELLVRTAPYGGVKLFSSSASSNGVFAQHALALPLDPSLFGLPVSFQGLVGSAPGDYYCNALDAILSPYE